MMEFNMDMFRLDGKVALSPVPSMVLDLRLHAL